MLVIASGGQTFCLSRGCSQPHSESQSTLDARACRSAMLCNLPNVDAATQRRLQRLLDAFPGYDINQDNGQRQFGPPTPTPPTPGKGCEVFVGKLPRDLFEDELVPLLASVGRLYKLRLMMDFSGTTRGYAFVQYQTASEAEECVRRLSRHEVRKGHRIAVSRSLDNCRLYVGGLPVDQPRDQVDSMLRSLLNGVIKVFTYVDVNDRHKHRGFAFVEFASHREAALARRSFFPSPLGDRVTVDWAEPEYEVDDETMRQVKVLFIRNVVSNVNEAAIRRVFARTCGPEAIEKVKKCKNFAFVHFFTREAAELCKEKWNGVALDGAELQVSWAKPVTREQHCTHKQLTRMQRYQLYASDKSNGQSLSGHRLVADRALPLGACVRGLDPSPVVRLSNRCAKFGFSPPGFRFYSKLYPKRCDNHAAIGCQVTLCGPSGLLLPFRTEEYHETPLHAQVATCQLVLDNWNRLQEASAEIRQRCEYQHACSKQSQGAIYTATSFGSNQFHSEPFPSGQFHAGHASYAMPTCQPNDVSDVTHAGYYQPMLYDQYYQQHAA